MDHNSRFYTTLLLKNRLSPIHSPSSVQAAAKPGLSLKLNRRAEEEEEQPSIGTRPQRLFILKLNTNFTLFTARLNRLSSEPSLIFAMPTIQYLLLFFLLNRMAELVFSFLYMLELLKYGSYIDLGNVGCRLIF